MTHERPGILDFDTHDASPKAFAEALFDRPIAGSKADKDAMTNGEHDPWFGDKAQFVQLCTRLFEWIGELAAPYSNEQVGQGLWMVMTDPYFLPFYLTDEEVPLDDAIACVKASYHLYSDLASTRAPNVETGPLYGALYGWWDEGWRESPPFLAAVLETLERILALSDLTSRHAALHGLAHYKQDWDEPAGKAAIDRFITRERDNLSEDLLAYAEFCRDHFHA